jgi:tetratricopeptide (TPR) repeat protein
MNLEKSYNFPKLKKSYKRRPTLLKKLEQAYLKEDYRICALVGPIGSGKASTAVDFASSASASGFRKLQHVIYFNSSSAEKLDLKYRLFAEEYLKINTSNVEKAQLIEQVNEKLKSSTVLFIFADVYKYSDVCDYIERLPFKSYALLTTHNTNIAQEKFIRCVTQELYSREEAFDYIKSELTASSQAFDEDKLNELVECLDSQILAYDLQLLVHLLTNNNSIDTLLERLSVDKTVASLVVAQQFFASNKFNDELVSYLAFLDHDFIPWSLLARLYSDNSFEIGLLQLSKAKLIELADVNNDSNKFIRLEHKTSDQLFAYLKMNKNATALSKIHLKLLATLNDLFVCEFNSTVSVDAIVFYSNVARLLNLDLAEAAFAASTPPLHSLRLQLYIKISFFNLYFICDYGKALRCFQHALTYMTDMSVALSKSLEAKLHLHMGKCHDRLLDYRAAIAEKLKCLKQRRELPHDKLELIESLESLSYSHEKYSAYDKSINYDLEALEMKLELESSGGVGQATSKMDLRKSIARSYANLGNSYTKKKNYAQASEYFLKCFEIRDDLYKFENSIELFLSMNALSNIYEKLQDEEKALYYGRAADQMKYDLDMGIFKRRALGPLPGTKKKPVIDQKRSSSPPPSQPRPLRENDGFLNDNFEVYHNYEASLSPINEADGLYKNGLALFNLNEFKSSLSNFQRALEIYEKYSKEEQAAYCLDKMGLCYLKLRKYVESHDYLTRSLHRRKQIYSNESHPDVLISLNSLALYYDSIGETSRASSYRSQAYALSEKVSKIYDLEYATSINNLGVSYLKLDDLKLAFDYLTLAFKIRKRFHVDKDNADLASSLFNLAVVYFKLGKLNQAMGYAKEAAQMRSRLHAGENNGDTADAVSLLGIFHLKARSYETAKVYLKQACEMRQAVYTGYHPYLASSYYNLGTVYGKLMDITKSTYYFTKAYEIRKSFFEPKDKKKSTTAVGVFGANSWI